mmetsp:Transcript_21230/g.44230  ORF Transcript_21230/g.44230 Transcript_21230/m.44230 type:complete len:360 (+) Transcript_21230:56-1135(+)
MPRSTSFVICIILLTSSLVDSLVDPIVINRRSALSTGLSGLTLLQPAIAATSPTNVQLRSEELMPLIGFGTYKTSPESTTEAVSLALESGVRHIDGAQDYLNEKEVGTAISNSGIPRSKLFLTSKISNSNQGQLRQVTKSVKATLKSLNTPYLDVIYVHSPLPGYNSRMSTYSALQQLKEEGFCRSVGVANYGIQHLDEIVAEGLDTPDVCQFELSFYNQRRDECDWCTKHGSKIVASSWSKLSGNFNWGSDDDYKVLNEVSTRLGLTKAQTLVAWCYSKGIASTPRSGVGSKIERLAIAENSEEGVMKVLGGGGRMSDEDVAKLDALEQGLKMGRLGRTDGWRAEDVKGTEWDLSLVA